MLESRSAHHARSFLLLACWLASAPQPSPADEDSRYSRATMSGQVVDEAGKPVAGAMVLYRDLKEWRCRTGLDGEFSVSIQDMSLLMDHHSFSLVAKTDDGRLGVFGVGALKRTEPVRIVVKTGRTIRVLVVDAEENPVAGASIVAMSDWTCVFEGETGPDGHLSFSMPVDLAKASVAALKPKVGIAFVSTRPNSNVTAPTHPLPDSISMKLEGVGPPLKIKAVDERGEPIPELNLSVPLFKVAGVDVSGGLGRFSKTQTGQDGVAVVDWLPRDIGDPVNVFTDSHEYHPKNVLPRLSTSIETDQILAHVRFSHLSGIIRTADGQPVSGAGVKAKGFGSGGNFPMEIPGTDVTDSEGRYSMLTNSNLAYVVTATKGDLIGFGKSVLITRPGERTEAEDMILRHGTWMHGTVTKGIMAVPAPLQYLDARIELGSIPEKIRREGAEFNQQMRIRFSGGTDEAGRYRILLPAGKYDLSGPGNIPIESITIPAENPPAEFLRDYNLP
ncbi:carboxypeptidase-like regulatory domain-containing protein [Isosphaeraceae bacterium EP7]